MPSGSSDQQMVVSLIPFLTTIYHIYLSDRSITLVYFYLHITPEAHRYKTIPCSAIHIHCIIYIYICVCFLQTSFVDKIFTCSQYIISVCSDSEYTCIYNLQITPLTIYCYFWITRPFISTCTYIIDVLCRYTVYTCFLETVYRFTYLTLDYFFLSN